MPYADLMERWANVEAKVPVFVEEDGTYHAFSDQIGFGYKTYEIAEVPLLGESTALRYLSRSEAEQLIAKAERILADEKLTHFRLISDPSTQPYLSYYMNTYTRLRNMMPSTGNRFSTNFEGWPDTEKLRVMDQLARELRQLLPEQLSRRETLDPMTFFKFWRKIFDLKYSGRPYEKTVNRFWGAITGPVVDWNRERVLVFRKTDWIFEHLLEEYYLNWTRGNYVDDSWTGTGAMLDRVHLHPDYVLVSPSTEMSQSEWDQRVANAMKDAELEAGITDGKLTLPAATAAGRPTAAAPRPGAVPVVAKPKDRTLLYAGIGAGAGLLGAVVIALASGGGHRR